MHSVQEEPKEFLRVLLAVPGELSGHPAHLGLQVAGRHHPIFILAGLPEKVEVTLCHSTASKLLFVLEICQKVFG